MKLKGLRQSALALAASAALAACGSGQAQDDSALKVMTISIWDNATYDFEHLPTIVENAAGPANQAGGINGQKVEVIPCNTKGDPNEAERCARKAADEKVAAVAGGFSLEANRIFPILEQAKIPYIGGTVTKPIDSTSPMAFPTAGGPMLQMADGVRPAENDSCNTIAMLTSEQSAPFTQSYVEKAAAHYKRQPVRTVTYPEGATDMAPYVQQWIQGNPDCLLMVLTPSSSQQALPAMKSLQVTENFRGRIYASAPGGLTEDVLKKFPQETEGIKSLGYFPPGSDPVWTDYLNQMKAAGNLTGVEGRLGDNSELRTYLAYKVFEIVAKTVSGPVTNESLLTALGQACSVNVGSMSPTLDFCKPVSDPAIARSFNNSFVWYEARDGHYVQSQDGFVDVLPAYLAQSG